MYAEWVGFNVNQVLDYTCASHTDDEALVCGDKRLSYRDFQLRIFKLAQGLRTLGVRRGTRVAHIMDNSPEWALVFLALARLGAITIPLNLTWVGREIVQSLDLTDAEILVTVDEFRGRDYIGLLTASLPALASGQSGELELPELPHLKRVVTVSRAGRRFGFADDYAAVMACGTGYSAAEWLSRGKEVAPDDECLYLPTSGSTGFPKPVVHTNASFLANCSNYADAIEFTAADRLLNYGPTYHVSGLLLLIMPLIRGGAVHQMNWFEPEPAMALIEREKITAIWGFDAHYLAMRRHPRFGRYDLASLRCTMIGSSPGSYEEIKSIGLPHHGNIYGCSEYLADFLPYRDRFDEERARSSNGRPMDGVEQKITDPATGRRLAVRELGEICVKGPGLFKGYYKMPDLTAAVMDAEGYFHTGDYGWVDEHGYLYYRGRLKDTVKSGGENVSAREVELFLESETPWVSMAAIFGIPDPTWGEAVTAMVELRPGAEVSEAGLREYCRGRLANYKIPKRVLMVEHGDWVITPTGKLDKTAMRDLALERLAEKEGRP
jgi:fatty-acyl-CoA synthase